MTCFVKRDDCIWLKHLSPNLQLALSRLAESEPVTLRLDGQDTVWCRMRSGPQGPINGIRIRRGTDIWRAIPRGAEFSLELSSVDGASAIPGVLAARYVSPRSCAPVLRSADRLFGEYFFADYSGAATGYGQKKSIKVAFAKADAPASLALGVFTRESLMDWMHQKLLFASERGVRVCLGEDHSYGFPMGLARELGIAKLPWRLAIANFLEGSYAADALASLVFLSLRQASTRGFDRVVWRIISGRRRRKATGCLRAIRARERMRLFRELPILDRAASDAVRRCRSTEWATKDP